MMTSVGTKVSPPPKLNVIASPPAVNPISAPMAPAFAARSTFRLIEQPPRSISAILPAGLSRYGSGRGLGGVRLFAGHPRPTKETLPVTPAPTGAQSTVAVFGYEPAIAAGLLMINGNATALGTCVCATLITSGAVEGELTMYGRSPA